MSETRVEEIHVKPGEGRRVRHPLTRAVIGPEGVFLPHDSFVARRLADGDLVLVTTPATDARAPRGASK